MVLIKSEISFQLFSIEEVKVETCHISTIILDQEEDLTE